MTYARQRKPKYLQEAPAPSAKRTGVHGAIKLRLNARTIVTVKDEAAVRRWQEQYPDLIILETT